jgi:hypothetical protein
MLVDTVRAAGFPKDVLVWIGSYGPNRQVSDIAHSLPSGRYAPMFSIQPGRPNKSTGKPTSPFYLSRNRRAFTDEQWEILDEKYSGEIPSGVPGRPLPASAHFSWGRELGCRYRDSLRLNQRVPMDGWQFDELVSELVQGPDTTAHQDFARGILYGLRIGRPHKKIGDTPQRGFIWAAGSAIRRLPTMPITARLQKLWEELDKAAAYLVGQEYPRFNADPRERARRYGIGQRNLLSSPGAIRRSLGQRYIAGFSPGIWIKDPNLGGRASNQKPSDVRDWRLRFIDERARARPAGVAEFCFLEDNCTPEVVSHVMEALAKALRASPHLIFGRDLI